MKQFFFVLFFYLSCLGSFAQKQAKVDSLKKLGRDALIKLAVKEIGDPAFDPKAYDRVVVKADSISVIVEFSLSIRFMSGKSCYYDQVYVSLIGGGSGKSMSGDCSKPKFYKPTASQKKKIDFVFTAINKDNDIGDVPDKKLSDGESMEITEYLTYYYIEFKDWSTFSHYKIDKVTGKIYDAGHKHYAHYNDEKERYEIIK